MVYEGRREGAGYGIEATLEKSMTPPEPGSLEFFLVERYLLYAARGDRLWSGRVFHSPYRLRSASIHKVDESLVLAAGLEPRPFVHSAFSEGVDVEIFPLRRIRD